MKPTRQKTKKKKRNSGLDFKGLPFEEVLSDLLKIHPEKVRKPKGDSKP